MSTKTVEKVLEYKKATRADGVEAHNLEWTEDADYIFLRIGLKVPPIPSSNGKPLISTSRGFITLGATNQMSLSLNGMDRRKA